MQTPAQTTHLSLSQTISQPIGPTHRWLGCGLAMLLIFILEKTQQLLHKQSRV